jgi:hypothetical protein
MQYLRISSFISLLFSLRDTLEFGNIKLGKTGTSLVQIQETNLIMRSNKSMKNIYLSKSRVKALLSLSLLPLLLLIELMEVVDLEVVSSFRKILLKIVLLLLRYFDKNV